VHLVHMHNMQRLRYGACSCYVQANHLLVSVDACMPWHYMLVNCCLMAVVAVRQCADTDVHVSQQGLTACHTSRGKGTVVGTFVKKMRTCWF
jgi:hypothetical protein